MKKYQVFFILNISIPLLLGLVIYFFLKPDTYVIKWIFSFFNFNFTYSISHNNLIVKFIYCYLCDILWAYALTFAVYYFSDFFTHKYFIAMLITIVFCVLIEFLQFFDIITGAFDVLDILFEIIANVLALMYIFIFSGGYKK